MFVELSIHPERRLLRHASDRLALICRAAKESPTHQVELVAWRLRGDDVVFVIRGSERAALRFGAFLVVHHARATDQPGLRAARHARVLPSVARAWDRIAELHGGEPLADPWTSLWDGIGLRRALWFDARALRGVPAHRLLADAGWSGPDPGSPLPLPEAPGPRLARAATALVSGLARAACPAHLVEQVLHTSAGARGEPERSPPPPTVWLAMAVLADPRLHEAALRTP